MSLESLFQHIIFSEHQAEESRRLMREVRSEINRCRGKIQRAAEQLNEEKIQLESKVQQFSEKAFFLQLLKTHENALERQCNEITNQRNMLLQTFEATKRRVTEEEEKFIKEITDFNNEYELTKKRELLMKENVKIQISDLENQANILKMEMKSMEHDNDLLNELQKQKSELIQELFTLQRKLKGFEDKKNGAICTTKYLEAEKIKISEKPQNDAECLRLKKELELYKEDDMQSVYDALQSEIEFLELVLLKVEDVNCINLDWINGSLQYIHAVNNLRVVGAEVAYFIDVLVKKFGYSASKVHLIGHSLGAHLAGEAGSRTPGLGRITGLDPAGPCFHDTPNEVRLDPSDANFVDVIHTNAVRLFFELGAGTINACGHLDFYPNGGKHMPGCEDLITPLFKFDLSIYKEGWRHKLSVKLDGNSVTQGSIFLRVGGMTGKTGEFELVSGTLKPGMTYTDLIDADINVGNITSIEFIWKEYSFEHSQSKLGAEMVIDISGKYGYK
ncbi:hypothetical protein G4228_011066 [Cervus hanglu yarkandensis]|nr:hypothetical protein G4228_011066 [Cervus hanglu yarkandensis]